MQFGKEKANRWAVTALSGFFQGIIVIQPIKVAALSMFIAAILRKVDQSHITDSTNSDELMNALNSIKNEQNHKSDTTQNRMKTCLVDSLHEVENPEAFEPPSKLEQTFARKKRKKEKHMTQVIWEMFGYVCYLWLLFFLSNSNRTEKEFQWAEHLRNMFLYDFEGLTTVSDFWIYVDNTLIPNLYVERHPTSNQKLKWKERLYVKDLASFRIGPARLRQIRRAPHNSVWKDWFPLKYEGDRRDSNFGNWSSVLEDQELRNEALMDGDLMQIAYLYQTATDLRGVPYIGRLNNYEGGGYTAELGVNAFTGRYVKNKLYENAWIDEKTMATFIEFTLYQPTTKLFATIVLACEFPDARGAAFMTSHMVNVYQIYPYDDGKILVLIGAQALYIVLIIQSLWKRFRKARRNGGVIKMVRQYKKWKFWVVYDMFRTLIDFLVITIYLLKNQFAKESLTLFQNDKRRFVSFAYNAMISELFSLMMGWAMFFGIVRLIKLMRFNQKVGVFGVIMAELSKQFGSFILVLGLIFMGHATCLNIIFAPYMKQYRSLFSSCQELFTIMLGQPAYGEFTAATDHWLLHTMGIFLYSSYSLMVTFVVLNYVISIICFTMEDSAEIDAVVNAENYELLNYATDKFSKYPGLRFLGGGGLEGETTKTSDWLLNESKLHIVTSRLEAKLEELDCAMVNL